MVLASMGTRSVWQPNGFYSSASEPIADFQAKLGYLEDKLRETEGLGIVCGDVKAKPVELHR